MHDGHDGLAGGASCGDVDVDVKGGLTLIRQPHLGSVCEVEFGGGKGTPSGTRTQRSEAAQVKATGKRIPCPVPPGRAAQVDHLERQEGVKGRDVQVGVEVAGAGRQAAFQLGELVGDCYT
jgi:hypothetical protein